MKILKQNYYILGLAFLLQFLTSFTAGVLQKSILIFPENTLRTLNAIVKHETLFLVTILLDVFTALGVIFLGSVLYRFLKPWGQKTAKIGFTLYILEALILLVGRFQTYSLLGLGKNYFTTERSETQLDLVVQKLSHMEISGLIMMIVFCTGAFFFYYLIFKSKIIPRPLSLWGWVSVSLLWIWTVLGILGIQVPFLFYLPYVPFEIVIAILFLTKGWRAEKYVIT